MDEQGIDCMPGKGHVRSSQAVLNYTILLIFIHLKNLLCYKNTKALETKFLCNDMLGNITL